MPFTFFVYLFFLQLHPPPRSTLFPYTTSSDLAGELFWLGFPVVSVALSHVGQEAWERGGAGRSFRAHPRAIAPPRSQDRKSTRLNSSHLGISYAVFCLKKKNQLQNR